LNPENVLPAKEEEDVCIRESLLCSIGVFIIVMLLIDDDDDDDNKNEKENNLVEGVVINFFYPL
jgi:hypothetical protein